MNLSKPQQIKSDNYMLMMLYMMLKLHMISPDYFSNADICSYVDRRAL